MKVKNQSKKHFIENVRFSLDAREKVLNNFKSNLFPLEISTPKLAREPAGKQASDPKVFYTSQRKKCSLKLRDKFLNKIASEEKKINNEIFKSYFWYYTPSFLVKDLYKSYLR